MANPENRSLVTSVERASIDGQVIPPLVVLPQKVHLAWFYPNKMLLEYAPESYTTLFN
jgi:hypothetical protein